MKAFYKHRGHRREMLGTRCQWLVKKFCTMVELDDDEYHGIMSQVATALKGPPVLTREEAREIQEYIFCKKYIIERELNQLLGCKVRIEKTGKASKPGSLHTLTNDVDFRVIFEELPKWAEPYMSMFDPRGHIWYFAQITLNVFITMIIEEQGLCPTWVIPAELGKPLLDFLSMGPDWVSNKHGDRIWNPFKGVRKRLFRKIFKSSLPKRLFLLPFFSGTMFLEGAVGNANLFYFKHLHKGE